MLRRTVRTPPLCSDQTFFRISTSVHSVKSLSPDSKTTILFFLTFFKVILLKISLSIMSKFALFASFAVAHTSITPTVSFTEILIKSPSFTLLLFLNFPRLIHLLNFGKQKMRNNHHSAFIKNTIKSYNDFLDTGTNIPSILTKVQSRHLVC